MLDPNAQHAVRSACVGCIPDAAQPRWSSARSPVRACKAQRNPLDPSGSAAKQLATAAAIGLVATSASLLVGLQGACAAEVAQLFTNSCAGGSYARLARPTPHRSRL